jgi:hypothetical protein
MLGKPWRRLPGRPWVADTLYDHQGRLRAGTDVNHVPTTVRYEAGLPGGPYVNPCDGRATERTSTVSRQVLRGRTWAEIPPGFGLSRDRGAPAVGPGSKGVFYTYVPRHPWVGPRKYTVRKQNAPEPSTRFQNHPSPNILKPSQKLSRPSEIRHGEMAIVSITRARSLGAARNETKPSSHTAEERSCDIVQ